MKTHIATLLIAASLLAGCSDNTSTQSVGGNDQAPQVDADPTPDTGTGGPTQTVSPDSTINSAPGQPDSAD